MNKIKTDNLYDGMSSFVEIYQFIFSGWFDSYMNGDNEKKTH